MTSLLSLATRYAKFKGTRIIEGAYKIRDDGTITFVLESGPKLCMTEAEMNTALAEVESKAEPKAGKINLSDGVNAGEASLAGKTLNKARKEKA